MFYSKTEMTATCGWTSFVIIAGIIIVTLFEIKYCFHAEMLSQYYWFAVYCDFCELV